MTRAATGRPPTDRRVTGRPTKAAGGDGEAALVAGVGGFLEEGGLEDFEAGLLEEALGFLRRMGVVVEGFPEHGVGEGVVGRATGGEEEEGTGFEGVGDALEDGLVVPAVEVEEGVPAEGAIEGAREG